MIEACSSASGRARRERGSRASLSRPTVSSTKREWRTALRSGTPPDNLSAGFMASMPAGFSAAKACSTRLANASKLAFLHLVDHLKQRGSEWLDVQVMTPHFESFGAKEISRKAFLRKLKETQALKLDL